MESIELVGIWKVVGCVVLCKNSDLSSCNGASLILRPDGSFSWFGPSPQGVLDLSNYSAYKVIRRTRSSSPSIRQTAVEQSSICLVFERDSDSTPSPCLCCEVTVKYGNTMIIQFPRQCLMHFRRVSKDLENSFNFQLQNCVESDGIKCDEATKKKDFGPLLKNNGGYSGESPRDISHTDYFPLAGASHVADPGLFSGSSDSKSETGSEVFQSFSNCDSYQVPTCNPSYVPRVSFPRESLDSLSFPDAGASRGGKEGQIHRDVSNEFSGPMHFSDLSPGMPSDLSSNVTYSSPKKASSFLNTNTACSQDPFNMANQSTNKECEDSYFVTHVKESNNLVKNPGKSKSISLEEPDSPPTSSVSSTPSTAQFSSHTFQDHSFSLLRALQEGYFSDLILVADNGAKFEVHSTILTLSFPHIIWENTSEEDSQNRTIGNSEVKPDTFKSHVASESSGKPTSKSSKKSESREEPQKGKIKSGVMHNCHGLDTNHSAYPETEREKEHLRKDAGHMGGTTSEMGTLPKSSQSPSEAPSKKKRDIPKVKLPPLPETVLSALLHYAYSESLPPSLAPETARLCLTVLAPPSPVAPHTVAFRNLCSAYLKNNALKQEIVWLTSEIHGCLSKMEEHLSVGDYQGMASSEDEEEEDDVGRRRRRDRRGLGGPRDKILSHPTPGRLCTAMKQAAREAALAIVLAMELCQVYSKNRCRLGKTETHEVAQFAASRLAPLASQLDAVLSALLRAIPSSSSPIVPGAPHSPPIHSHQHHSGHDHHHQLLHGEGTTLRDRLASHLVPEMESALEVLSNLAMCLNEDLEEIQGVIQENQTANIERELAASASEERGANFQQMDKDSRVEMLSYIHQRVTFYLFHLLQKKDSFSDLGNGGRFRVICQTLEQLSEELPIFLLRLRDALATIDEQLAPEHLSSPLAEWTSKVSDLLSLLSTHRSILQPLLLTISDLVQREQFVLSVRRIGLLNSVTEDDEARYCYVNSTSPSTPSETDSTYKLSLVKSLVTPPNARRSHLSRRALRLLQTSKNADMVFQVALPTASSCDAENPPVLDNRLGNVEWDEDGGRWVWRIGAHRAIVAARCDWFRRALLSGMKEAIKRQIVVHDTTPQLMQLFLQWIYGGKLQFDWNICQEAYSVEEGRKEQFPNGALGTEQLWALLVLADQLEVDDLKSACEHLLLSGGCHLVDPEATLACLSLADQVNARAMRSACLQHISCNPNDVVESELFEELPSSLQSEVYDRLIWSRPRKSQTTEWLLSTPEEDDDEMEEEAKFGIKLSNPLHNHSFLDEDHILDADYEHYHNEHEHGDESRRDGFGGGARSEK